MIFTRLIGLMHGLVVLSIYIAALIDQPSRYSFLCFCALMLLSLVCFLQSDRIPRQIFLYLLGISGFFLCLLFIGLFKGNEFGDAVKFFPPVIYMYMVIPYFYLSSRYSLLVYVRHYFFSAILLSLKIIIYYIFFVQGLFVEFLPVYDVSMAQPTWIGYTNGVVRVFAAPAIIIPPAIIFANCLAVGRRTSAILFLMMAFALLLSHTVVLLITFIITMLYYVVKINDKKVYAIIVFLLFCITSILFKNMDMINLVISEKLLYSVPIKYAQLFEAIRGLENDLFFGYGIGYRYSTGVTTIEVVLFHILATSGLFGLIYYAYLYFYWPVVARLSSGKDSLLSSLVFAFITVVIASFSNPFLMGGNSGLFFLPLIAARFYQLSVRNRVTSEHCYATVSSEFGLRLSPYLHQASHHHTNQPSKD